MNWLKAIFLAACISLTACAINPGVPMPEDYTALRAEAQGNLNALTDSVIQLYDAGVLSKEDAAKFGELLHQASDLIRMSVGVESPEDAISMAQQILLKVTIELQNKEQAK